MGCTIVRVGERWTRLLSCYSKDFHHFVPEMVDDFTAMRVQEALQCVRWVHNMETAKVGIREFRENLAGYLESGRPLAIMRHGETLGYYIPVHKRSRKAELEAMRAAAKDLDGMIATWGPVRTS